MKKETIIFALDCITRQEALVTKIQDAFGCDIGGQLSEYYSDRSGIFENLFEVSYEDFDEEVRDQCDDVFTKAFNSKKMEYHQKAEYIYYNIMAIIKSEANVMEAPNEETFKFEGTLRKVA